MSLRGTRTSHRKRVSSGQQRGRGALIKDDATVGVECLVSDQQCSHCP